MKNQSKKKKKGKKLIWLIPLAVVIIVGAVILKNAGESVEITPTVQTVTAQRGDLQEEISVAGTVAGAETVTVYAPASGTIREVFGRVGDEVKAGTLFVTYDLDSLEKELHQAELQNERTKIAYENTLDNNTKGTGKVKEANVNLPVLEQQISDHQEYLKRLQKELTDYQARISDEAVLQNYNLKKAQAGLQEELSKLTPGTEEYDQKAKELQNVLEQLEKLTLTQSLSGQSDYVKELQKKIEEEQGTIADLQEYKLKMESQKTAGEATTLDQYSRRQLEIDMELTELSYRSLLENAELVREGVSTGAQGVWTSISAVPGSQVSAGMPLGIMERTDQLKINASATKYALTRIKVGQKVEAVIGDKTYPATISHIDRFATAGAMNSSAVAFEAELLEQDEQIYLGMEAKMTIFTNKAENALILPTEAVNANKDGDFVYVVQNGVIGIKPVKVGIISKGSAEISDGITESDVVVLKYTGSLEEGMAVVATPAEQNR